MRAHRDIHALRPLGSLALVTALAAIAVGAATATADGPAPAPPCNGTPQITDAAGDGHHSSSDVLSAWLTEGAGRVQAVIEVRAATFVPEHSDADVNGSGFAFLFSLGGAADYVRTRAAPDGSLSYDYGTYSPTAGYFNSLGTTSGSVVHSAGAGTTTIDIPQSFGIGPGTILSEPFVLTYDGITAGVPGWVDHAPGGQLPDDPARGADYVVGSCTTTPDGSISPGGLSVGALGATTTAVLLSTPSVITGGRPVLVTGSIVPARGGVAVTLTQHGRATRTLTLTTEPDGSFAALVAVHETTRFQALAGGIHSDTDTVDVRSRTRLRATRAARGGAVIRGVTAPALPGSALLLRPNSPSVLARRAVRKGKFAFPLPHAHGAYQVVYVPGASRAERSTSNTVRIR